MGRSGEPSAARPSPFELRDAVRRELAATERAIREHRYLEALEAGDIEAESLAAFAGEQYSILSSDRRSFAHLAARFPEGPSGDFFLAMAAGESKALAHLAAFAAALGLDEKRLRAYEPKPASQAYTAFVAWLALNGSRSDVALAFLVNLAAWGANCARMAAALRSRYGLDEAAVALFEFFVPPEGFEERALAVAEAGLGAGDSPERARRSARLLQAYELMYRDALAEGL